MFTAIAYSSSFSCCECAFQRSLLSDTNLCQPWVLICFSRMNTVRSNWSLEGFHG